MAVNLAMIGGAGWQFFDDNGNPLSGGKIYTYAAGTSTFLATYTDNTGGTANTNPVILDAAGRTPSQIWSTTGVSYKYVIKTSLEEEIRTWDNISNIDSLATYLPAGTGAVATTVQAKLREIISINDFGAPTSTEALQAAITFATGRTVTIPNAYNETTVPASYDTALLEYTGNSDTRMFSDTPDGIAKRLLKGQLPLAHSGSRYSVLGVEAQPQGSGINGPASADCGLTISTRKKGFNGATRPPTGEIDGLYICVRQDGPTGYASGSTLASDASGILVDIQNVGDCGFTSAWEAATSNYDRTAGAVSKSVQTQIGIITANLSPVASYGFACIAKVGALGSAYYAGKEGAATWDNILDAPGSVLIDKFGTYRALSSAWGDGAWTIARTADSANASTQFNHRGTGALFLNCAEAGAIQFGTGNTIRAQLTSGGHFAPYVNLLGDLGQATARWSQLFGFQVNLGDTSTNGIIITTGVGPPEGSVTANMGSLYLNRSGGASTTLYVKTSGTGNTGWTAK